MAEHTVEPKSSVAPAPEGPALREKDLLFEGEALSAAKIKEEFGDIDLFGVDALNWFKGEK